MKRTLVDLTDGEPEEGEIIDEPAPKRPRTIGEALMASAVIVPTGGAATLEMLIKRFSGGLPDRRTARDARVTFIVKTHRTYLDGDLEHPLAGVTDTIESRFFAKFDAEGVSRRLEAKAKAGTYKGKYKSKTADEMRAQWNGTRDAGSASHDAKETILRGLPLTDAQRAKVPILGADRFAGGRVSWFSRPVFPGNR